MKYKGRESDRQSVSTTGTSVSSTVLTIANLPTEELMLRMRRVALLSVSVGTAAIALSLMSITNLYARLQFVEMGIRDEVAFCKSRSADLWQRSGYLRSHYPRPQHHLSSRAILQANYIGRPFELDSSLGSREAKSFENTVDDELTRKETVERILKQLRARNNLESDQTIHKPTQYTSNDYDSSTQMDTKQFEAVKFHRANQKDALASVIFPEQLVAAIDVQNVRNIGSHVARQQPKVFGPPTEFDDDSVALGVSKLIQQEVQFEPLFLPSLPHRLNLKEDISIITISNEK